MMTLSSLSNIEAFIDRYRDHQQVLANRFQVAFFQMKEDFTIIREQAIERARSTAPGFNVFDILGLSRFENRTHSNMLAHLFSPTADHGQQHLFLSHFLRFCAENYPQFLLPEDPLEEGHWEIITELPDTSFGRMDIVVRSPDLGYLCVIENKVDADEQPGQLTRYSEWMATQQEDYPDQVLLFLSPDGRVSSTAGSYPYIPISYHRDITEWLEHTFDEIQAPKVREIVSQYRDLVKKL